MSRINDLIAEYCPNGVEYRELAELVDYQQPSPYIVSSTNYDDSFSLPVLTAGQSFILGYSDDDQGIFYASAERPVIIFDDFTTSFHWVDFDFKVKSSAIKMLRIKPDVDCSFRYVYYAMSCIQYVPKEHSRQWISIYSTFKIPVPPLPVQEEIVRILDSFSSLEAELEAELEARRKQYAYYRDELLTFDRERVLVITVGELCDINRGRVMSKGYLEKHRGAYPVYSSQTANNGRFGFINSYDYDGEYITWTTDGANAGSVFYHDEKFSITNVCGLLRIKDSRVRAKYLKYVLDVTAKQYVNTGMGNPKLMSNVMKQIKVGIPSLAEQDRIISILDRFDKLTNDLSSGLPAEIEARRKQYEYYRDRLLSFDELAV